MRRPKGIAITISLVFLFSVEDSHYVQPKVTAPFKPHGHAPETGVRSYPDVLLSSE
jgi:hypothetical protein